jgi:hypothetical protein
VCDHCGGMERTIIVLSIDGLVDVTCNRCGSLTTHATAIDGVVVDHIDDRAHGRSSERSTGRPTDYTPTTLDSKINALNVNPFSHKV